MRVIKNSMGLYIYLRVAMAFLFILIMCIAMILLLRSNLQKESVEKNIAVAVSLESSIELYLDKPSRILQELHTLVHETPKSVLADRDQFNKILEEYIKPYEFFQSVRLIGNDGFEKYIAPTGEKTGYFDMSQSPIFLEARRSNHPYWSPVFLSRENGAVSVTLSQAYDVGVMTAYLDLTELRNRMNNLKKNGGSFISIVDGNGSYISHPDLNMVEWRELNRRFLDYRQNSRTNAGNYEAVYRGEKYLVTAMPLKVPNWTVLVYTPFSEVYSVADKAMYLLLFAVGLAIILSVLFTGQIVNTLSGIFSKFIDQITEIANGNYFLHMKREKLSEFNKLADQFNKMTMEIQSREKVILFNQNRYRSLFENASVSILEFDLSEVAKYLDALKEKENGLVFREYFTNHPEEVIKCLEMSHVIDMNRHAQNFFYKNGKTRSEIDLKKLLAQNTVDVLRDILITLAEGNTIFEFELPMIDPDGNLISMIVNGSVIPGYEKSLARVLASTVDITQRKIAKVETDRVNRDLKDLVQTAVNELREKDRMMLYQSRMAAMGEMLRNISHQWRQPLNALGIHIQNLLDIYKNGQLSADYIKAFIDRSMTLILHMSKTIDDFRNFFKPDKEPVSFSLKNTVEKTLSIIEASMKNNFIKIETDIQTDNTIRGYPNEYSQVLLVILNNAKDVLVERKVKDPLVKISIMEENGRSVVTITDNAGGIEPDISMKIFEPYFTTKSEGTGIGLYMSKMIIENNMGGKLTARNADNGAEFRIVI